MNYKDWNTFVCGYTDVCESVQGTDREKETDHS